MEFPNEILIIGVGESGIKAVNYLSGHRFERTDHLVADSVKKSFSDSQTDHKILLNPLLPINLNQEFSNQISIDYSFNKRIVFVIAGLGCNKVTSLESIIANHWKDELLVLTIGIAILPSSADENSLREQAIIGMDKFQHCVDSLICIDNDKVNFDRGNSGLNEYQTTDYFIRMAVRSFTDLVTGPCYLEYRYSDIYDFARNGGRGSIVAGESSGKNRGEEAVRSMLSSPILSHIDPGKIKRLLLNIILGSEETNVKEITDIAELIYRSVHEECNFIWNFSYDPHLNIDKLQVSLLGFGLDAI